MMLCISLWFNLLFDGILGAMGGIDPCRARVTPVKLGQEKLQVSDFFHTVFEPRLSPFGWEKTFDQPSVEPDPAYQRGGSHGRSRREPGACLLSHELPPDTKQRLPERMHLDRGS